MSDVITKRVEEYVESLQRSGHPSRRVATTAGQLDYFVRWASRQGIIQTDQLSLDTAADYYDHLSQEPDIDRGGPAGPRLCRERITKLRRLLSYLREQSVIEEDLLATVPMVDQHGRRKNAATRTTKTFRPVG